MGLEVRWRKGVSERGGETWQRLTANMIVVKYVRRRLERRKLKVRKDYQKT